jgi:hypothetical protein
MDLWSYCSNAVRPFNFLKIGGKYMENEGKLEKFEKAYFDDLKRIKETIRENQNKAMVVVNSAMIMTYYEIGTIINKRKTCSKLKHKSLDFFKFYLSFAKKKPPIFTGGLFLSFVKNYLPNKTSLTMASSIS